ncbi:hypothetical protein WR25_14861 [Diploscapter pachys]|uniref:Uncharacterized protein n=1 Tax=Diploscapter pachys TaxID=2018661 RepID=A0A2A2KN02_9BILA|nr:hypothetical protein WR25_14861 [Diploscapter pachys]
MSKQTFSRISTTLFDVWLVTAISTSFMAGTGLKKWSPPKFSGLAMTGSKSDRRIEEILDNGLNDEICGTDCGRNLRELANSLHLLVQ